jgi:hypothetical protein
MSRSAQKKAWKGAQAGQIRLRGSLQLSIEYDCDRGTKDVVDISARGGAQALESANVFGESWPK